jgi:hypothetical protein
MAVRQPLCKYFSPAPSELAAEIEGAYLAFARRALPFTSRSPAQQGVNVDAEHVDVPKTALHSLDTPDRPLLSVLVRRQQGPLLVIPTLAMPVQQFH